MMNSGTNELLQNLDMEMQLLKKKREVIEQQMICSQRMQLQNEYNPGPSNVSYGQQYQPVHRPAKRQNITPWQNEPLTKINRPVSRGDNSWYQSNQSSYPKSNKQQYNQFHQYKNKQQNKKFVPPKVEKNKPKQMNKPNPIRPNLAPVRNTLIDENRTVKKPNDDIFAKDILYPDKVPTEKMTGRLELALGMILKELRKEYWNVNVVKRFFDLNITKRELKFTIRERLRDLLLNKPVPHHGTIHTMYRRKYPIESDAELINTIGQNHNLKDKFKKFYLVFNPTEQPQEFVENNFKSIISNKLRDMFKEIEVIYKNKSEEEIMKCTLFDHMHILKDPNEPRPSPEENKEMKEKKDDPDQPVDMNKPYKEMNTREKLYYIKKHVNEAVNAHLPSLLASCAADISNLLCDQESTKLLKGSLVTKINPKFKGMFLKKTNFNATEGKPENATNKGKYYAKVSCHPRLPSREEMQPFLNSFKPCAIKKPKNSDEIVVVLFNTKEEREALLAANGTVLHDKYPLNIVAAEAAVPTQQKTDNKDINKENDNKDIKPDNKDPTPLAEQETIVKTESSDDKIDLTIDAGDKNDNEVTKANDEQTAAKTEESSKAGENNEEQASSDKIQDIETDNENVTHDADTEMSDVSKPDNKDNGPSNDEDSEINKTNIEQESSNNGDLETSNEDNTAITQDTSMDYGDVISVDLDQQIDDLLTSISRTNAEMESEDNESKKDSQVDDESKVDQTQTVELDDDNSRSNEELKINEDSNAEGDSAMVVDDAKETDENNTKVVSDESKAETREKVKEDAKSKNESVGPVRASGRIATRRSSRFVTNN